jgi:hypothetical protein
MPSTSKKATRSLKWRAPEYIYLKKTPLWYTHVSIFFYGVLLFLFLVENYMGLVIIALLFWYFISRADDKPKVVDYKTDDTGITIGERKLTYGEIHSFTIDESNKAPVILFDLNYHFALPVTMILKDNTEEVVTFLIQYVPMRNEFSLIRWITHKLHY